MRIVQLVESLEVGGLERMALDLARALKSSGHDSRIWCLFHRGALAGQADAAGIGVEALEKPGGFSPRTLWRMVEWLRRDRPDILHTHNLGTHVYGAPAAALAGVKTVVSTRHGFVSSQGKPYREDRFRFTLPFTSAVVAVSEHTLAGLRSAGAAPPAKSAVIYNGICTAPFLARPATPGATGRRFRFGTVGRLVPAKGHSVLIEALSRVPGVEVHVAGDGPLRAGLEQEASRLGLSERITFLGRQEDVAGFLSSLDVFVFPSLNEGLPLAILEALAAGLPIVASRVGGVPEAAPEREVAWYCPPGDPAALASALQTAVGAPDLAQRGAAARARAQAFYDLDVMCRRYLDLYRKLTGGTA